MENSRITCLECSDGTDTMDFCVACLEKECIREEDGRRHTVSHGHLQLRQSKHLIEIGPLLARARQNFKQSKALLLSEGMT